MSRASRWFAVVAALSAASVAWAQDGGVPARPSEDAMFGAEESAPAGERPSEDLMFGAEESAPAGERPSEDAVFQQKASDAPERPSGDSMFQQSPSDAPTRGDAKEKATDGPLGKANAASEDARADDVLSGPLSRDKFETGESVDDPLMIGGQFYLRYFANAVENTQFKNIAFSSPNLLDLYLDGRPADRVRAFARFRMRYDPTYDPAATNSFQQLGEAIGAGAPSSSDATQSQDTGTGTVSTATAARANPDFLLDQLWLNFDILRTVYVTAGRQHIRWTVSRFWQPTDFLSPALRDPLAVFDQRLGANALKLHYPIESLGWNFYAVTLLDNFGPANTLGDLGQAFRGEVMLGPAEVGATAVFQRGRGPRYGLDVSSAVGPVDVYGEMSLRPRADRQMVRFVEGAQSQRFESVIARQLGTFGAAASPYETFTPDGPIVQATGGATYTFAYSDTDTITLGAEYFYNQYGYTDRNLFPAAFATGTYVPFYAGQQYFGAYAVLLGPGSMDNGTFVASTLGNLSDSSYISRLDFSYRALAFLQLEAFAAYHYGQIGEFHYGFDLPPQSRLNVPPAPAPGSPDVLTPDQRRQLESVRDDGIRVAAPTFDFGVGVRISL